MIDKSEEEHVPTGKSQSATTAIIQRDWFGVLRCCAFGIAIGNCRTPRRETAANRESINAQARGLERKFKRLQCSHIHDGEVQ